MRHTPAPQADPSLAIIRAIRIPHSLRPLKMNVVSASSAHVHMSKLDSASVESVLKNSRPGRRLRETSCGQKTQLRSSTGPEKNDRTSAEVRTHEGIISLFCQGGTTVVRCSNGQAVSTLASLP